MLDFLKKLFGFAPATNQPHAPYKIETPAPVAEPVKDEKPLVAVTNNPVSDTVAPIEQKPKRARTNKGKFKPDDKSTDHANEAWEGGKSPAKKQQSEKKTSAATTSLSTSKARPKPRAKKEAK